ncbi:outer membrane protein OmpU [Aliiruegeria haliotis]|uniref:Outer membrane protein OmpU n=1 Tax=Aliiruegeria haliotis TaxID=1280846 RepID=A0A2T0RT09_9RHOB|nr:porin [Aliiruegeria haliotis]PRY24223.1 outer membrane protein OmpU [Aliiruegeria haliotis]
MKKVLFTSTALVAFAGAASAEVSLGGWAEMGVIGGDGLETQFFQDVDVDFTLSGETDSGLTFGANVDLDEAGNLGCTTCNQGVDIFVSGEFGTVTLGDTDGALDWAVAGVDAWGNPGSIADDETAHWGRQDSWLDGAYDGQILRYDYKTGDFGVAVSLEQDDRSDLARTDANGDVEDSDKYNWAVGATYAPQLGAGTLKLGLGYQQSDRGIVSLGITDAQGADLTERLETAFANGDLDQDDLEFLETNFGYIPQNNEADKIAVALGDDASIWALSAGYVTDSGISIGAVYSDWAGDELDEGSYWGIGGGYAYEAFSIHLNYGEHKFEGKAGGELKAKGYGLAMGYDLGGGLSVLAGYGKSEGTLSTGGRDFDFDASDTYSLGLSMSF